MKKFLHKLFDNLIRRIAWRQISAAEFQRDLAISIGNQAMRDRDSMIARGDRLFAECRRIDQERQRLLQVLVQNQNQFIKDFLKRYENSQRFF